MSEVAQQQIQAVTSDEDLDNEGLSAPEIILIIGVFILMVGVGASCERELFQKMLRSPKAIKAAAVGVICQFVIMPFLSYLLSVIFGVKGYSALGFLLVGCMPGGSTSNIFTMWTQGVLELSVFMTLVSTLVAFGLTPLWLYVYSHAVVGLDGDSALGFQEIALTFALLIVPLAIGAALNCCAPVVRRLAKKTLGGFAILVFLAVIVMYIVQYFDQLFSATYQVFIPGIIYFPLAAGIAYGVATLLQLEPALRRTVMVEVGFQNLALSVAIGEVSVKKQSQLDDSLLFPLVYVIFMYFWGFLLVPFSRRQKSLNDERGIVDNDPDFFLPEESDDDDDDDAGENKNVKQADSNRSSGQDFTAEENSETPDGDSSVTNTSNV